MITLGIIGVVAAMTMPTLINQTNGAQYRAAFKKELSVISQAVTLNVALDDWDFSDLGNSSSDNSRGYTLEGLLKERANVVRDTTYQTIAGTSGSGGEGYNPQFNTARKQNTDTSAAGSVKDVSMTSSPANNDKVMMFNDGSMFIFAEPTSACTEASPCAGWFDVNGMKGPNKETKCDANSTGSSDCSVKIPTDIFPVKFYDQTILPNSGEGRAVLYDNGNTATKK